MRIVPFLFYPGGTDRLLSGDETKAWFARLGEQVAVKAKELAPIDTGAGAASIAYEVGEDFSTYVRVSWSPDYFYMFFHEVGTSDKSARPFLRPALDAQYTV